MHKGGKWVYLRDGSTLTEFLEMELMKEFAQSMVGEGLVWDEAGAKFVDRE